LHEGARRVAREPHPDGQPDPARGCRPEDDRQGVRVMKAVLSTLAIALAVGGCASTQQRVGPDQSPFIQAAPRSVLIGPPVNHSLDVDAPTYMLSMLTIPLAEKGFYVFPVNTTKVILEHEGFYEGDQIQQQPTQDLAKLFGADAELYVTINRWDAQYL